MAKQGSGDKSDLSGLLFRIGFYNARGALLVLVDIHSHILPGLDDGSQTMEETLAMLQIAAENGTTDIVATPHAEFVLCVQRDKWTNDWWHR